MKKGKIEDCPSVTEMAHKLGLYSQKLRSTHVRDHVGGRISFRVDANAVVEDDPAFELVIGPDAGGNMVVIGLESDEMEKLMHYFAWLSKHALSQQKQLAERYSELSKLVERKVTNDDTID